MAHSICRRKSQEGKDSGGKTRFTAGLKSCLKEGRGVVKVLLLVLVATGGPTKIYIFHYNCLPVPIFMLNLYICIKIYILNKGAPFAHSFSLQQNR